MSSEIISLILENKKRFYRGELRNRYFDYSVSTSNQKAIHFEVVNHDVDNPNDSLWQNFKNFGQRITDELFYEPDRQ